MASPAKEDLGGCCACALRGLIACLVAHVWTSGFAREVEMFKAGQGAGFPMRVYDLVYDGGSDHKRYLTFLAREKEVRAACCLCMCA